MIDDEYLEVFGSEEARKAANNILKAKILKDVNKECTHNNKEIFPDGKGFCKECGEEIVKCTHSNTFEDDNGLHVCKDCGSEVEIMNFEPEWRYYGASDNRLSKDPSRCHKGTAQNRGIAKVFEEHHIKVVDAIKAQVEVKYNKIVGKDTVRGKGRKAIIAACLFHVYQEFGEYRTSDYVRELFKLPKKKMSGGLSKYYETFPKSRVNHIDSEKLIRWIINLTGIDQSHYKNIVAISRHLKNSSILLKRSSPQSVSSAVIYFYLCLNPEYKAQLGLTKNKFASKALLSDITVTKLVKEAATVAQCVIVL